MQLWDDLLAALDKETKIEGEIVAVVKGGLSVDIGTKAFLPASHASLDPTADLSDLVGLRVPPRVIQYQRGRLVVSRRFFLEQARDAARQQTLSGLAHGDVIDGKVVRFTSFGAFVDIGGLDGLLHLNDISWGRIKHASEVLQLGQVIVKVLKVAGAG
ncbi:MAG: S1 RNA-binding domain-containing protein [Myxococcota bacterium]